MQTPPGHQVPRAHCDIGQVGMTALSRTQPFIKQPSIRATPSGFNNARIASVLHLRADMYVACRCRRLGSHPAAFANCLSNNLIVRDWTAHIMPLTHAVNGLEDTGECAPCARNAVGKVVEPAVAFSDL
jgi:hypothetical protein